MKAILAGALGLVLLQAVLASPLAPGAFKSAGGDLSSLVARFTDPTVPLIGSAAPANPGATSTSAPVAPTVVHT